MKRLDIKFPRKNCILICRKINNHTLLTKFNSEYSELDMFSKSV